MVRIARTQEMPRLSPTGVNTYPKWLTKFLNWCQKKGKIARVPASFSEIKVADTERKEDKRLPFSDYQLQTYFSSCVFEKHERNNCLFWVSLIAVWNGMRSNEICQLYTADVVEIDGIWGFDITHISATGDDDKSVKTNASIRLVPIHPKLIEFGFLDFHSSRPKTGKLCNNISRGKDGYYSSTFSKKSNRYLKMVGVSEAIAKFDAVGETAKQPREYQILMDAEAALNRAQEEISALCGERPDEDTEKVYEDIEDATRSLNQPVRGLHDGNDSSPARQDVTLADTVRCARINTNAFGNPRLPGQSIQGRTSLGQLSLQLVLQTALQV